MILRKACAVPVAVPAAALALSGCGGGSTTKTTTQQPAPPVVPPDSGGTETADPSTPAETIALLTTAENAIDEVMNDSEEGKVTAAATALANAKKGGGELAQGLQRQGTQRLVRAY